MMTRQLGSKTVKERKFTNNLGKWRGAAGNSYDERLSFWPTRGQIQNRVTVKFNVCVMLPKCMTFCSTPLKKWSDNKVFSFKMSCYLSLHLLVDHFTVVCIVAWPLNESEAGVELFFIESFQHLCPWCCSHAY